MNSILDSIKKLLGITKDYTHFDDDIIIHINSVFPTLRQLGVGPADGFTIKDNTAKWSDFISEDHKEFESVKTYVYMKVKLIFDPPLSSAVMESYKGFIKEFEWRLNVDAETPQSYKEEEIQNG